MGDIYEMILTVAKNNAENRAEEARYNKVYDKLIGEMIKAAMTSNQFHYVCDAEADRYYNKLIDALLCEGFRISNVSHRVEDTDGNILQYPAFTIGWKV